MEMGTRRGISSNFVVDAEQSSLLFHVPEVAQLPCKLGPEVQRHVGKQRSEELVVSGQMLRR